MYLVLLQSSGWILAVVGHKCYTLKKTDDYEHESFGLSTKNIEYQNSRKKIFK